MHSAIVIALVLLIPLAVDAREEQLRWTHDASAGAAVRFEASVNDGARLDLGAPTPDAAGIYAATIQTEADPARIRAFAVNAEGVSSFASNEIVRTSGEPAPEPDPGYTLLLATDCVADGLDPPLDGATIDTLVCVYLWPETNVASVAFTHEVSGGTITRTEKSPPYSLFGDGGASELFAGDLLGVPEVRATVELTTATSVEEVVATLATDHTTPLPLATPGAPFLGRFDDGSDRPWIGRCGDVLRWEGVVDASSYEVLGAGDELLAEPVEPAWPLPCDGQHEIVTYTVVARAQDGRVSEPSAPSAPVERGCWPDYQCDGAPSGNDIGPFARWFGRLLRMAQ